MPTNLPAPDCGFLWREPTVLLLPPTSFAGQSEKGIFHIDIYISELLNIQGMADIINTVKY